MCGRFTLTTRDFGKVAEELDAELAADVDWQRPRYNIAPTDPHPIVVAAPADLEKRLLRRATWGITKGESFIINARSEQAPKRFKEMFARGRCAVPADGFYEWRGEKKHRMPIWFHRPDGGLLLFAALWEQKPPATVPTFMILTTGPNQLIAPVHDRMPVVLPPARLSEWLRDGDPAIMVPADDALLVATAVSPRVNSVRNDDPDCLTPPPGESPPPQLKLL
jgi:putative SOS response-associated peptidase YedK